MPFCIVAFIYNGDTNSITVNREYFFDFSCNFDLMYYPFDTQVCVMDLEAPWGSGFKLMLPPEEVEPNRGITISPQISLLEYEILGQRINIHDTEKDHAAKAVVKLVIRRRMEYHLTSTFMQTLILIGVGFMSLFFKEENFTDRIMVSITNLVVVATITSSVQQVSDELSTVQ